MAGSMELTQAGSRAGRQLRRDVVAHLRDDWGVRRLAPKLVIVLGSRDCADLASRAGTTVYCRRREEPRLTTGKFAVRVAPTGCISKILVKEGCSLEEIDEVLQGALDDLGSLRCRKFPMQCRREEE